MTTRVPVDVPVDVRVDVRVEHEGRAFAERELAPEGEGVLSLPPVASPSRLADFVCLAKPRITFMVLVTTLGGAGLALRATGAPIPASVVAAAVVGVALVVAGANALNMFLERDTDRLMARTRRRPLPAGRMAPTHALAFGLVCAGISTPLLALFVNALTAALALFAFVSYVFVYTPLKRRTTLALPIGAVPGAIPPLLGWTAVTGRVEPGGLVLFAILFLWQLPHFHAIALFREAEYTRAGLVVLPAVRGPWVTRLHIAAELVLLVAATLALQPLGLAGGLYTGIAAALGAAFMGGGLLGLRRSAGPRWARRLFAGSIVYLILLIAALTAGL